MARLRLKTLPLWAPPSFGGAIWMSFNDAAKTSPDSRFAESFLLYIQGLYSAVEAPFFLPHPSNNRERSSFQPTLVAVLLELRPGDFWVI